VVVYITFAMAGPKEPGKPGENTSAPLDGQERVGVQDKSSQRGSFGRIPSLTPLTPVRALGEVASGKRDPAPTPEAPKAPPTVFRPNVTAFWTPSSPTKGAGGSSSGFIRIATPVTTRPDGVVSILPSSSRTANVGSREVVQQPETPPFGISARPPGQGGIPGSSSAVPSRVAEGRSARIPFRVGPYEVATRIAQGGTGSIYVCRNANGPQPQSLLTLKVIRQHALQKDAAVFSFRREARVGALFRHPNAQTVIDVGEYEDQPFLILPYIEGGNLSELLGGEARPHPANIVTVILDVLRALQHAHQVVDEKSTALGLVHADVSPDNVLVGIDGVARLTDFGSARFTTEDSAGQADGFGLGKPSYMSPEQLRGEPLDARSDIFAVGVVMWSALTGQKLFAADTYDQTVMRVMRKKIPPPSSLGAPACLDEVCLQALSRSPEGRYSSANQMADALMTAAVKADLVATRERVAQWVRRDIGETLAERRRRVEQMFGDRTKAPSLTPQGNSTKSRSPDGAGQPATTIQMNAVAPGNGELGAVKTLPNRTLIISPGRPAVKLSRRQWYVVVSISLATFFVTLAFGTWLSRWTSPRRSTTPRPVAAATANAEPRAEARPFAGLPPSKVDP